ncbi:MAG: hypothetical protein ACTSXP_05855 [Promethearchaeota archaeon]
MNSNDLQDGDYSKETAFINKIRDRIGNQIGNITTNVVILGKGFPETCTRLCDHCQENCKGVRRRILLRKQLEKEKFNVDFFEDVEKINNNAIEEEMILMDEDVHLVILLPESFGSCLEFGDFYNNEAIASKLRIFVNKRYHPIYGESHSYLPEILAKYMVKYGHVYYFENNDDLVDKTTMILRIYRSMRLLDIKKAIRETN